MVRTTFMSHDYDDAQLTWNKVIRIDSGLIEIMHAKNRKEKNHTQNGTRGVLRAGLHDEMNHTESRSHSKYHTIGP